MLAELNLREANPQEDPLIAQHFSQLWRDIGVSPQSIQPDWLDISLQFIDRARQELFYKAFVAEVGSLVVGSASCQLFAGLYPHVLAEEYRKYGYIWGVYVEPDYRGKGIGQKLTRIAVEHLKSLGCTRVILHASPLGKPVYNRLGFTESNEMRLDLS
jgi:ribosomal protein S18 acetylase RimI-like enzyme